MTSQFTCRSHRSALILVATAALAFACSSESGDADGDGGAGGAVATGGGDTGAGGASAGGAMSSGGASSGGALDGAGGVFETAAGGSGVGGDVSGAGGEAVGGSDGAGGDGTGGEDGTGGNDGAGEFELTSPSWTVLDNEACDGTSDVSECGAYPKEHLSTFIQGDNMSPELNWSEPPEGTMGFAVVLHDLSNGNVHWAVWSIGADVRQLPGSLPAGAISDPAGAEQDSAVGGGYFGSGACGNTYEFRVYALSDAAYAPPGGDITAFRDALETAPEVLDSSFARLRSGPPDCAP